MFREHFIVIIILLAIPLTFSFAQIENEHYVGIKGASPTILSLSNKLRNSAPKTCIDEKKDDSTGKRYYLTYGLGISQYSKLDLLVIALNFSAELGDHLFLNLGMDAYKNIHFKDDPPDPSTHLLVFYNFNLFKDKLSFFVGPGISASLFTSIGVIGRARINYAISRYFSIGGEIVYNYRQFKFYKYPLYLINLNLNVNKTEGSKH